MKANGIMAVVLLISAQWGMAASADDHTNHHSGDHASDHSSHASHHPSDHSSSHPQAHSGSGVDEKARAKGFKPTPERVIKHLDDNGDGLVSIDEFKMPKRGPERHRWEALDSNDDGQLTRAEVQGQVSEQWQRFEAMDTNNDDKVTRAEVQAALFSRLDSNADGYLDAGELKQMQDERRHRHQGH